MIAELELLGRADCVGAGLRAEQLALHHGWSPRAAGEVKLVVVELCWNAVVHAEGGRCRLDVDAGRLEITVEDDGPGLPPWALSGRPLEGGNRRGLGEGLACARRLSTDLHLANRPTRGARVVARRFNEKTHPGSLHA